MKHRVQSTKAKTDISLDGLNKLFVFNSLGLCANASHDVQVQRDVGTSESFKNTNEYFFKLD